MTKKKRITVSLTDECYNYLMDYQNWLETLAGVEYTKSQTLECLILSFDFPMSSK